jgi:hypothetical protein
MSLTGDADGEPYRAGVAVFDVIAGLHAALGVLAALVGSWSAARLMTQFRDDVPAHIRNVHNSSFPYRSVPFWLYIGDYYTPAGNRTRRRMWICLALVVVGLVGFFALFE